MSLADAFFNAEWLAALAALIAALCGGWAARGRSAQMKGRPTVLPVSPKYERDMVVAMERAAIALEAMAKTVDEMHDMMLELKGMWSQKR